MLSKRHVLSVKAEFTKRYWRNPWRRHITGVGISTLGSWHRTLARNRSREWCIVVFLLKELPKVRRPPDSLRGVRILYEVTGPFYLY